MSRVFANYLTPEERRAEEINKVRAVEARVEDIKRAIRNESNVLMKELMRKTYKDNLEMLKLMRDRLES